MVYLVHEGAHPGKMDPLGPFGTFLFFQEQEHDRSSSTRGTSGTLYAIEVDDHLICTPRDIVFDYSNDARLQPWIDYVTDRYGIDEGDALDVIGDKPIQHMLDLEEPGEEGWLQQWVIAEAARSLGFAGVEVQDELGYSIMLDMEGREDQLQLLT